jgi:ABC-type phosphate/phosphonate transport system permease subunit
VPLGVAAAVCLSDVLPFWLRQYVKPVIEVLAAIPSVAYGFFALVVFAPLLQDSGAAILTAGWLDHRGAAGRSGGPGAGRRGGELDGRQCAAARCAHRARDPHGRSAWRWCGSSATTGGM